MTMEQLLRSQQFKQALFDVQNEECERLEAELALHPVHVSPEFEQKMERLIRAQRKPFYRYTNTRGKKAVLALAAAFILMATLMFSVSAIREPVMRFFVQAYETFSRVFFHQQETEDQFPATLETLYMPTWLPEGYQLDESMTVAIDSFYSWTFSNADGREIKFEQFIIANTALGIDTEGVPTEEVFVNGHPGLFYSNKGISNLTWNDGRFGFYLTGPIPREDLQRIAQSLETKL